MRLRKSKHALVVAHATTAAAEAAVTTALVAAEIVQFTRTPQYNHQCVNDMEEFSVIRVQGEAPQCNYQCVREIHEFAATWIQSAFRGLPCEFKGGLSISYLLPQILFILC